MEPQSSVQPSVSPAPQVPVTPAAASPPVKTMGPKTGAIVILLIGLFAAVGGYFIVHSAEIPNSYVTTTGQVNSASPAQGGNYNIQIEFTAQDNQQYSFVSQVPSQSAHHNSNYFVGQRGVQVAYNPHDPGSNPKNASDKTTPVFGRIIEIVGIVFAVIGFISLVQQLLL